MDSARQIPRKVTQRERVGMVIHYMQMISAIHMKAQLEEDGGNNNE